MIKDKIKRISRSLLSAFLVFIMLFIVMWAGCFIYTAVGLVAENISYTEHSVGDVLKIARWSGMEDDGDAYNFTVITYRYRTKDGRWMIGKEDTNIREATSADRCVETIGELNTEIWTGARQDLLYDPQKPENVVSEYYRKNNEMLCLFTGSTSAAAIGIILIARMLFRRCKNAKRKKIPEDIRM